MSQETPIRKLLSEMRATIKRLEELGIPVVERLAMDLRHQMIDLTARLNEQDASAAARRMTGAEAPLTMQAPVDDTPLFAHAASSTAPDADVLERRMMQAHWREGDHTLDSEEDAS